MPLEKDIKMIIFGVCPMGFRAREGIKNHLDQFCPWLLDKVALYFAFSLEIIDSVQDLSGFTTEIQSLNLHRRPEAAIISGIHSLDSSLLTALLSKHK